MTAPLRRELLPCPFCGEKPEALHFAEGSTFRWLDVSCPSCGASPGEVRVQTLGEGTKEQWRAKAKADAIEAWNTRAPSPELAAARKAERERAANLVFELGPQLTSIGAPLWQKLGLAVRRMKDE